MELRHDNITLRWLQDYIKSKDHHPERRHVYFLKLVEEVGELADAIRRGTRLTDQPGEIKGTLEEELYDVLYYVLALANIYGADLEECCYLKECINSTRVFE